MRKGYLSQYFDKVVFKILGAVETDQQVSHQHEFNGVKALRELLGEPDEKTRYPALFLYLSDDEDNYISEEGCVTWYDARENHPTRTEWRLYYNDNRPMQMAREGDTLYIAKSADKENLLFIIAEKDSTASFQLQWLFGTGETLNQEFSIKTEFDTEDKKLDLPARFILEQIGISIDDGDENYLEEMLSRFNNQFPPSAQFSLYARNTLPEVSCLDSSDLALVAWMEREEMLYRTLEKHLVGKELKELILKSEDFPDTDPFLELAMSTFQRRKARAGAALENHLEEIFQKFKISYTRNGVSEQRHRPDFIFPGIAQYRDKKFPANQLIMLGAKSTCKDRWRQILNEAARIPEKHLLTLEPSISKHQTNEMRKEKVRLVIPNPIHSTYSAEQQKFLMSVDQFIKKVRAS